MTCTCTCVFEKEEGLKEASCRRRGGYEIYPPLAAFPPKARFFRSARLPLMLLPLWLPFASSYLLAESDCGEHGCWSHGTCKQGVCACDAGYGGPHCQEALDDVCPNNCGGLRTKKGTPPSAFMERTRNESKQKRAS